MSGPTWLPPKQVAVLGQPDVTVSSPAVCRVQKSFASVPAAPNPAHRTPETNGAMGSAGGLSRDQPPPPGPASLPQDSSADSPYSSVSERGSRGSWDSATPPSYTLQIPFSLQQGECPEQTRGLHPTNIDVQIDSLTSMLADMESSQQRRGERANAESVPYPALQPGAPKPSPSSAAYKPTLSGGFMPLKPDAKTLPYGGPPASGSPYPAVPVLPCQYGSAGLGEAYGYHRAPKPYPQPMPASYATASSSAGPPFSIQVKVAKPVVGYNQPRRRAEPAYGPPSPKLGYGGKPPTQYASEPGSRARPHDAEAWYPEPPSYGQRPGEGEFYAGPAGQGRLEVPGGQFQSGLVKAGKEELTAPLVPASSGGLRFPHQPPSRRPEEELDRLTKKLIYDLKHPPTAEYFGRCAQCGENVVGDGTGCVAMDQVFHVECFTCATCHCCLRGQPFYAIDRRSYCESCYIVTLEKCSMCSKPIMDRILRAMGKAYHPQCFICVVCHRCLDGIPFTVDATSQIHCIEDFHRKFAPRCSVCAEAIMPEPGQEETVRIVALDRSFHIGCYKCEECDILLSSEGEGRGCYPLDGHILCKNCSARRIQDLSSDITTDC
ncbi:thyroid receptor-interacting protein 6 isoform X1 [Crotalus tigris]|uniref:thyroid receptor-interacting protein 6 isoform X1 n=1 Tax=Crotalus tigris TaxID=88082 RepID=UPI00192F9320|nr:thyroid receptor-interacting protein 6 isoform X1 [Crotalus tigris]